MTEPPEEPEVQDVLCVGTKVDVQVALRNQLLIKIITVFYPSIGGKLFVRSRRVNSNKRLLEQAFTRTSVQSMTINFFLNTKG